MTPITTPNDTSSTSAKVLAKIILSEKTFPIVLLTSLKRKNDLFFAVYKAVDFNYNSYYKIKINSLNYHSSDLKTGLKNACENSIYWEKLSGRKEVVFFLEELKSCVSIPYSTRVWNWIKSFF